MLKASCKQELRAEHKAKRIDLYDIVKGIGILLVVAAHIYENNVFLKSVYGFHMPLFLIITGMLLDFTKSERKPYKTLIVSRFKSMIIPYAITELICIPLYYFRGGYGVGDLYWIIADSVFLYVTKAVATWFLLGLFLAESLYFLILKLIPNKIIVVAICTVGYVINVLVPMPIYYLQLMMRSVGMMFFLMLGHQFAPFFRKERKLLTNIIFLVIYFIAALWNDLITMVDAYYGNPLLALISSITGSALIISLGQYISKANNKVIVQLKKYLVFWGRETIIVLCSHLIFMRFGFDILLNAGPHYSFFPSLLLFTAIMLFEYGLVVLKRKAKELKPRRTSKVTS